jgi:hypothetical protein
VFFNPIEKRRRSLRFELLVLYTQGGSSHATGLCRHACVQFRRTPILRGGLLAVQNRISANAYPVIWRHRGTGRLTAFLEHLVVDEFGNLIFK